MWKSQCGKENVETAALRCPSSAARPLFRPAMSNSTTARSRDKSFTTIDNVTMSSEKTIRRLKTYAGAQGWVYQYYFVGKRSALGDDPEAPATEFVFDVTSDRKLTFAVSIFLPESSATAWAAHHARPLTENEQYAAAKLRLFSAFDELEDMKAQGRRLVLDAATLDQTLTSLGVE